MDIIQDPNLTTYTLPKRKIPPEKVLDSGVYITSVILLASGGVSLVMIMITFFQILVFISRRGDYSDPVIAWSDLWTSMAVTLTILLLSWAATAFLRAVVGHYYEDVPQGKVIKVTVTLGGDFPVFHEVVLQGYNRMMQLRKQTYDMEDSKRPTHNYQVGEYIDFSK